MKSLVFCMRTAAAALLAVGMTATAYAGVTFDGSPGTAAPPATLGGYTMTAFGDDTRTVPGAVTTAPGPDGDVTFGATVAHADIPVGWATWSHGYVGDVYSSSGSSTMTMTMPANTVAFYFYAEPNVFSTFTMSATTDDGTTSGPVSVNGTAGAKYFGFYGTDGSTIVSITVTAPAAAGGFAVGEFGIFQCPAPTVTVPADITINCHESSDPSNTGEATATDDLDPDPDVTYADVITAGACPQSYTITRTWTATNDCGTSTSDDQTITVQDVAAPTINLIGTTIELWDPDHLYRTVNVTDFISSIDDNCATLDPANATIESVSSDEPDNANGNGDGNTVNDIVIAADCHSVQLRSERNGNGNGRVYRINVSMRDDCGNETTASYAVHVRKNQGNNGAAVEGAPAQTITSACGAAKRVGPGTETGTGIGHSLMQNFPNPFSTSTVIEYTVATSGAVHLTVVDAEGTVVSTLVDESQDAGTYSTRFDSNTLPSGNYFYRLESAGERLTRAMVIAK